MEAGFRQRAGLSAAWPSAVVCTNGVSSYLAPLFFKDASTVHYGDSNMEVIYDSSGARAVNGIGTYTCPANISACTTASCFY